MAVAAKKASKGVPAAIQNNVIFKTPLDLVGLNVMRLPKSTRFLTAQYQKGVLCLWYMFDRLDCEPREFKIAIIGTGNPVGMQSDELSHIATVQNSQFVWHVFQVLS